MNEPQTLQLFTKSATPRAGASETVPSVQWRAAGLTILWPTGTTAGKVNLHTAPRADYAGNWPIALTVNFASGGVAGTGQAVMGNIAANFVKAVWEIDHAGGATPAEVWLNLQ